MENILKQIYASSEQTTKQLASINKNVAALLAADKKISQEAQRQRKVDEKHRKREIRDKKREATQKKKDAAVETKAKKKNAAQTKKGIFGTVGGMIGGLAKFLTGNGLVKLLGGALVAGVAGWAIWKNREWLIKNVWEPIKEQWDKKVVPMWENKIKPWIEEKVWKPMKNELKYFGGVIAKELKKWLDKEVLAPIGAWVRQRLGIDTGMDSGMERGVKNKGGDVITANDIGRSKEEAFRKAQESALGSDDRKAAQENYTNHKILENMYQQLEGVENEIERNQRRIDDFEKSALEQLASDNMFVRHFGHFNQHQADVLREEVKAAEKRADELRTNMRQHQVKTGIQVERRQSGGHIDVPGSGNGDQIPMMLPSGSFVLNRNAAALFQNGGMIPTLLEPGEKVFMPGQWGESTQALNNMVPRFQTGGEVSVSAMERAFDQEQEERLKSLLNRNFKNKKLSGIAQKHGLEPQYQFNESGAIVGIQKDEDILDRLANAAKAAPQKAGELFQNLLGGAMKLMGHVGTFAMEFFKELGGVFDGVMGIKGEEFMGMLSNAGNSLVGAVQNGLGGIFGGGGGGGGGGDLGDTAASGAWAPLLDLIASVESVGGSYNSIYPSTTKPGLSEMTIAQADAWQARTAASRGSAAAGRYQFMRIKEQAAAAGIGPNELFSPANQDKMATALITQKRGVTKELVKSNPTEAARRLAMEWAGLPVLAPTRGRHRQLSAGQSYYAGDGRNASHLSPEVVKSTFQKLQTGGTVGSIQNMRGTKSSSQARYQQAQAQFAEMMTAAANSEPIIVFEDEPESQTTIATASAGIRTVPSLPDGPSTSHAAQYMYKVAMGGVY